MSHQSNLSQSHQEIQYLSQTLKLTFNQVKNTITLFDQGDRIPFIARYRKEKTQGLDEVQLRHIEQGLHTYRQLQDRKKTIVQKLDAQQQLTSDLRRAIEEASTLAILEDLYAPFKMKRQSKAQIAIDHGLSPVADALLEGKAWRTQLEKYRKAPFLDDESLQEASYELAAHKVSQNPRIRGYILKEFHHTLEVVSRLKKNAKRDEHHVYQQYFEFKTRVRFLKAHQLLALRRGEKAGALTLSFKAQDDVLMKKIIELMTRGHQTWQSHQYTNDLNIVSKIAYQKKLKSSIAKTLWKSKEEEAEQHSIQAFTQNLKALLLSPPLLEHYVLAIDPGLRTGCKYAVLSPQGQLLAHGVFYTHDQRKYDGIEQVKHLINTHKVQAIAIGNGTGCREAEWVVTQVLALLTYKVSYALIDEAGASVYSASEIARQEFPHLDVSERGAVSIGRRLQDPLAELIKIDVQSMGIGMYQHDVNQNALQAQVKAVVEDAVNSIGADLNTASKILLQHIAGLGPKTAQAIIEYRNQHGAFHTRKDLMKVKGLGAKTFEQCAGFLRIYNGPQPLDASAVHPEGYDFAQAVLQDLHQQQVGTHLKHVFQQHQEKIQQIAQQFKVGSLTLADRLKAMLQAGRDVRSDLPAPLMKEKALNIEQLQVGQVLKGKVRNVVDFGAFIDLGMKQAALLHISEIKHEYVSDPYAELQVGQVVDVKVLQVDLQRSRISVSRKACLS